MPQAIFKAPLALSLAVAFVGSIAPTARADEVTDWNQILARVGLATGTPVFTTIRNAAIVEASVFDAVDGIDQRYTPLHVTPAAPAGASARAAAVQAAYTALLQLYPTQKALLDARRFVSLAALADREDPAAIASGISWGETVATAIVAWRSTDGANAVLPPFVGGTDPGTWRPTPPGFLPMAGLPFATATPWILTSPSQLRPGPPPALTSAQYAADFNEVKLLGSATSTARTTEQTTIAWFWASTSSPVYLWNALALSLLARGNENDNGNDIERGAHARHALVDHAHLFALLNIALADAFIAIWDSKLTYAFWRPITAIQLAATDGNPATMEEPAWTPLVVTPAYPSYVSGLVGVSAAAAAVLAAEFGDRAHIIMQSDLLLGVTRSFRSFSAVIDEIVEARIYAGIHYRFDDAEGRALGAAVGNYVLQNALVRQ